MTDIFKDGFIFGIAIHPLKLSFGPHFSGSIADFGFGILSIIVTNVTLPGVKEW